MKTDYTKFELFLLNKGYKDYNAYHKLPSENVSSMTGGIWTLYKKEDKRIVFGLHEFHKPATLISPRPIIIDPSITDLYIPVPDDYMNRALMQFDCDTIYEAMFNQNIILKLKDNGS